MYNLRRKLLSQNFLHSRTLVNKLVRSSSVGINDLVLEIGPGRGIITEQLIHQAGKVIVVELDKYWYDHLSQKFSSVSNLSLFNQNFLDWSLPRTPYKVFSNIPFSIEGKIIRKLIDGINPPQDCYLVMMKELAYRLTASYKENRFSIIHKPWFDFSIVYHFHPTDFSPLPKVNAVVLRFTLKGSPLLLLSEKVRYQRFVVQGFGQGLPVANNLKNIFPENVINKVFQELSISRETKPSYLRLEQWISLYNLLAKIS